MKVEVVLDAACTEPELTLRTAAVTGEVEQLLRRLSEQPPLLCGERAGRLEVLDPDALVRVYAAAGRVYAVTEKGEHLLRMRLYEAEARLAGRRFVRISHSEIVNLKQVTALDLSLAGTIKMTLAGGAAVCWVSRRYVPKIKQALGLGRGRRA